jgi:hypothetical protein
MNPQLRGNAGAAGQDDLRVAVCVAAGRVAVGVKGDPDARFFGVILQINPK